MGEKELDLFFELFCDCDNGDPLPVGDEDAYYVPHANIPSVGFVDHHGVICGKCGKYIQIG